jgi:SNF2 family DNA or RNA helicase
MERTMKFTPHSYQRRAAAFILKNKRCAAHIDMGLGKTAITLTAICELLDTLDTRAVLVVAPLRVAQIAWPEELRKWDEFAHLTHIVVSGDAKARIRKLTSRADIYLINYELVPWLVEWIAAMCKERKSLPFDMIVFDESSRLKSPSSTRFKCLKPLCDAKLVPRIVELTGTPCPESYTDLWSQYRLLDGGVALGKFITHFRHTYYDQHPHNEFQWDLKPGAAATIQARIAPLTATIRAEDHLSLPPLLENNIYVDLPPASRKHYDAFKKDMLAQLADTTVAAPSAAQVSEKCRQVCSGGVYDEAGEVLRLHDIKFDALDELLEDLVTVSGQCVLVVYWYRHEAETIRRRYPSAPILGPGQSEASALACVRSWNARKIPVLFVHPASVGHGINLQAGGSHMVFVTVYWSNELYRQTVGRIYRQGQPDRVTIHRILMRRTIDELVDQALQAKEGAQRWLRKALAELDSGVKTLSRS